eukprot:TRINITY_DN51325_c0_g1_i1.p1 TRINITY_DN51325_c0_g1~~TRINITY_DN51325_c0_g1_i1.p1  ORF type:complete len:293 (-),score=55.96 TRINITY_DN51325_c0_g1_i1:5-883(-)
MSAGYFAWPALACLLVLGLLRCVWRHRDDAAAVIWTAHEHEEARHHHEGLYAWRDCTGLAPSSTALKRAYRNVAKEVHADKGGTDEAFRALQNAQGQLQSPVQFNLRSSLLPQHLGEDSDAPDESHGIHDVRIQLHGSEADRRLKMEVDFRVSAPRGYWKFGLLAQGQTAIEYGGDGQHGYDICCQFMKDSHCAYKPYDQLVAQHSAHTDTAWDSMYTAHDCPLQRRTTYTGVVDKPLHVDSEDGLWSAVLELFDAEGRSELACVAATFRLRRGQLAAINATADDADARKQL